MLYNTCGFGFVTSDGKSAMEEAIEAMNGIDLEGRSIMVLVVVGLATESAIGMVSHATLLGNVLMKVEEVESMEAGIIHMTVVGAGMIDMVFGGERDDRHSAVVVAVKVTAGEAKSSKKSQKYSEIAFE